MAAIPTGRPRVDASKAALPAPNAIRLANGSGAVRLGRDATNALASISVPALASDNRLTHVGRNGPGSCPAGVRFNTEATPVWERMPVASPNRTLAVTFTGEPETDLSARQLVTVDSSYDSHLTPTGFTKVNRFAQPRAEHALLRCRSPTADCRKVDRSVLKGRLVRLRSLLRPSS